ncbi:MAG TPA: tRNA 2-thiouridine(34) synthase MnmA [Rickettsiales bacterium]|nr:tRNA 2-thiouridine(34) synthase MnmA [Rickettsiales bacterium]
MSKKILVAMSGGVDSSVVALKLLNDGYEVEGATLNFGKFCDESACIDAKKVADQLGIKHHVIYCGNNFENKVVKYFIDEYTKGNTPNPCIKCNREVKFYELLKFREEIGVDFLATGHYTKITEHKGIYWLEKGEDFKKDQSYFLGQLKYDYLQFIKFPLADIEKTEVKEIAKKLGLSVADKPESQDVCFTHGKSYKELIKEYYSAKIGDIIHIETGKKLAEHSGIINYTQGQRKGLNIGGTSEPLFVVKIDAEKNIIYIGSEEYLFKSEFKINNVNFLDLELEFEKEYEFDVKLRSTNNPDKAKIIFHKDLTGDVKLLKPSRNISKGQLCGIYRENRVVASGFIYL